MSWVFLGPSISDKLAKEAAQRSTAENEMKLTKIGQEHCVEKANGHWQQQWEAEVRGRQLFSEERRVNLARRRTNKKEQVTIMRSKTGLKQNIPMHGETFNNRTTTYSVQAKYRRKESDYGWTEETGGE